MASASRLGKFQNHAPGPSQIEEKVEESISSSGKTRRFDERLPQIRSAAAGIDVGGSEIWVDAGSRDPEPVRKFATFTADLHELADWLILSMKLDEIRLDWILRE